MGNKISFTVYVDKEVDLEDVFIPVKLNSNDNNIYVDVHPYGLWKTDGSGNKRKIRITIEDHMRRAGDVNF